MSLSWKSHGYQWPSCTAQCPALPSDNVLSHSYLPSRWRYGDEAHLQSHLTDKSQHVVAVCLNNNNNNHRLLLVVHEDQSMTYTYPRLLTIFYSYFLVIYSSCELELFRLAISSTDSKYNNYRKQLMHRVLYSFAVCFDKLFVWQSARLRILMSAWQVLRRSFVIDL